MKKIIETGITKEILTGDNFPQLQIGDKLYVVDNRQKTFDKIQKLQDKEDANEIFKLALGEKEAKEIDDMNLSVENYSYLIFCVMGAITGEDPKTLQERAKSERKK
ncbi:MAG: hypothetical protein K2M17_02975 [Bacilli bacterium]|nr:hypothetical protein [Bacilli bacterium]